MQTDVFFLYLLVMAGVTYLIRMLPLVLCREKIQSRFLRSFLYYVPYITLAVMTFPAIVEATQSPVAGIIALAVGIILSFFGAGLFPVIAGLVQRAEPFLLGAEREQPSDV